MAGEQARRLILLRHAKSDWPEGVADHDRPLARRGLRDAPGAGRWLRASGNLPDLVLCSTARRAQQTWELAQQGLAASPPLGYEQRIYGATAAGLLSLARQVAPQTCALLIVGHDPAIRALTLELASLAPGEAVPPDVARVRVKFQTAAAAVLAFDVAWQDLGPGRARLTAFAGPADFAPGG